VSTAEPENSSANINRHEPGAPNGTGPTGTDVDVVVTGAATVVEVVEVDEEVEDVDVVVGTTPVLVTENDTAGDR
jgi:hypothetical protein